MISRVLAASPASIHPSSPRVSVSNTLSLPVRIPSGVRKVRREARAASSALSLHGAGRTAAPGRAFRALQIVGSELPRLL